MAEFGLSRLWLMRALYLALALVMIYVRLMPIQNPAGAWGAPDLLIAMTFAWVLRRPEYVPALAVAAAVLIADLLLLRPPGLMAALMVIATRLLRARLREFQEMPFLVEWLTVGVAMITLLVANRVVLTLLFVPAPGLGQDLIQTIMTILIYPLVVVVCEFLLGVRRIAPGEIGREGRIT